LNLKFIKNNLNRLEQAKNHIWIQTCHPNY